MKKSTIEKNRRANEEIRRVWDLTGWTLSQLADFLKRDWSYLNSIVNQGRAPSDEFLNSIDNIPLDAWPKSVEPALPWLKRIVNTHYIRTGKPASETEIFMLREVKELTELSDLQRSKIQILERQLERYEEQKQYEEESGNGGQNGGTRTISR